MAFEPKFTLTPRLVRQIITVERTRGFLDAVRLRPAWVGKLRLAVRVEDALSSLQIEGSSLTLEKAFDLVHDPPRCELRDSEREFLNYLEAFEAIDDLRNERDYQLRAVDVRNVHGLLVKGVRGGSRFAGQFRKEDVCVGDIEGGETVVHHQPPPSGDIDEAVAELLEWVEASKKKNKNYGTGPDRKDPWIHPLLVAGVTQHRLVWIHPFIDGNGRTARMMTTALLYQRGFDFKYLFNLSGHYNANRDRYYAALRTADKTGDYTEWLEYFCGGLAKQMYLVERSGREAAGMLDEAEQATSRES